MVTPVYGFQELSVNQSGKETTINNFFRDSEVIYGGSAFNQTTQTPPASPNEGDTYIVGSGATGVWAGQDLNIAFFNNGGWQFFTPVPYQRIFDISQQSLFYWTGAAWQQLIAGTPGGGSFNVLGADRTYFVDRTLGNDSNDGLTALTAWQTFQKALDVVRTINLGGFVLTVQLTDNDDFSIESPSGFEIIYPQGSGEFIIQGNAADRTLVTLPPLRISGQAFSGIATIRDLTLVREVANSFPFVLNLNNQAKCRLVSIRIECHYFPVQIYDNSLLSGVPFDQIDFLSTGSTNTVLYATGNCTLSFNRLVFNTISAFSVLQGIIFLEGNSYCTIRNGSFTGAAITGSLYSPQGNSTVRRTDSTYLTA